jgi:hypothetical protein
MLRFRQGELSSHELNHRSFRYFKTELGPYLNFFFPGGLFFGFGLVSAFGLTVFSLNFKTSLLFGVVWGTIGFIVGCLAALFEIGEVYEMGITPSGQFVAKSLRCTRKFPLGEIQYVRLAIIEGEGGALPMGIIRYSGGKLKTKSLTTAKFSELKAFFEYVVHRDRLIELREDTAPQED